MSSANTVPLRERGGPGTAQRILDEAERLFAERGYRGTSLREVAAAVGIRNPSVYNHFRSKAALYEAVLERAIGPVLNEFWGAQDEVERIIGHLAAHPRVARLILREITAGPGGLTPPVQRWVEALVARTEQEVGQAPAAIFSLPCLVVVAGYFASAPLYAALTGRDAVGDETLAEQTHIVRRVSEALFPAPPTVASD